MIKEIKKIIFAIFCIILLCSINFATGKMIVGSNTNFTSYLEEDESGNDEIRKVCDKFKYDYIKGDMTDFEKEMLIIKYLTSTVTYDEEETSFFDDMPVPSSLISDSFRAYGALVNHKAVCAGFAKAFELLARECDLQTMIITGTAINNKGETGSHAWNQICLDGEWYNVDITWETPIKNEYINVTDMEFSKTHIRNDGKVCTSTKYGHNVVAYYLMTGSVDININLDEFRRAYLMLYKENASKDENFILNENPLKLIGAKFDDGSNYFPNNDDTAITNYVKTKLLNGETLIVITTPTGFGRNLSIDSRSFLKDNININANIRMQALYEEGAKYDTRVLYFIIKY